TAVQTVVATATMPSQLAAKKGGTLVQASWSQVMKFAQISRPRSVCVKNQMMAPTRAVTAAITRPIGLADIAALKSHCAAVAATIAVLLATMAAVLAMAPTRSALFAAT